MPRFSARISRATVRRRIRYAGEREINRTKGLNYELKLTTRVPTKYRVVDMETGDVWTALPNSDVERGGYRWCKADRREVIKFLKEVKDE